jgi:hypothetical protein
MEPAVLFALAFAVASCAVPPPSPPTVIYSKTCTKTVPFQAPKGAQMIRGADGKDYAVLSADQPIQLPMMDPSDCPPP